MKNPQVDEEDLDQMWKEALVEFHKLSGRDPKKFTHLKVEDVLGKINQKKESDEKKSAKYAKAKDILGKTLTCIQTLGGLAAQGASMVFGPADMCFNAVSYLITVGQNYSKIFTGISELFERVSAFLERFEVYVRSKSLGITLDIHLRRIIHELLRSFMRICTLSIKVSKESKILLALEVFSFGTDKGVQAELGALEALVQRETGMSVALILESAKITEGNVVSGFSETKSSLKNLDGKVDGISGQMGTVSGYFERRENSDKRKEADSTSKQNREKIKQALKTEKELWRNDQEEFVRTRVSETGQWLLTDPQFSAWSARETNTDRILALEAREGFGKSYLSSMAVRHLYRLHPPGGRDTRISIAYYFFQKDNKDENSVNKALRAIIWQLIQHDAVYQKYVAAACDKPEEFGDTLELWKQLVVNLSSKVESTFFIVLDGIDEAETEIGQPLVQMLRDVAVMSQEKRALSLNLFITGRPKAFLEINDMDITLSKIPLGSRNQDDILKFINDRMDNMEIFKRSDQSDIQELKTKILDTLTEGAQGDFFKLNYMLTEISTKRRRKEIEEVLEHAGEDRQDTIAREIDRLNKSLGLEDIRDLNELLSWEIGSKEWPKLPLLEAVLLVKNGESSLVPLQDQIRDKYSSLFEISDDSIVTLRSDSIGEYFRKRAEAAEDPTTGATTALHESEVAIVRRFLRSVCDEELFAKFGFEEFFKRKLERKGALIDVEMDSLNILILKSCLTAICGEETPEMAALLEYAFYWLPEHLDEVDLALTPPEPKTYVGSLLIKLFLEDEYIGRWWTVERMWMRSWWIYSDDYTNFVMKWFKDSAVSKGLPDSQKEWVNGLTSNARPDDDLFRPWAKFMAKRWLRTEQEWWALRDTYWGLLGFVTTIKSRKDGSERVTDDSPAITLEQIEEIEKWAMSELPDEQHDSLWLVNLAKTFKTFRHFDRAIEKCIEARDLDPSYWRATYELSQVYAWQGNNDKAIEEVTKVIQTFRDDKSLIEKWNDVFYDMIIDLASFNYQVKNYDAAMATFKEVYDLNPDKYLPVFQIVNLLHDQKKYSDIIEFLQSMRMEVNSEGLPRLVAMSHDFAFSRNFHDMIREAGQQTNQIELIKDTYVSAVEAAKVAEGKTSTLAAIRFRYALFLYHDYDTEESHMEAMNLWEQNLALPPRNNDWRFTNAMTDTVQTLAQIYLQKAKDAGLDTPTAQDYLRKLVYLVCDRVDPDDEQANYNTNLILARFYHLLGDKEQARKSVRRDIKTGIDLLSDDDLSNDIDAYRQLAAALMRVGDDVNALAAWSLVGPTEEEEEEQNEEQPDEEDKADDNATGTQAETGNTSVDGDVEDEEIAENGAEPGGEDAHTADGATEETGSAPKQGVETDGASNDTTDPDTEDAQTPPTDPASDADESAAAEDESLDPPPPKQGPLSAYCDGQCGRVWNYADDMYFCLDCVDVQFEKGCLDKFKDGTLELKVCHKSHDFFYIPPWDEEVMEKVPKGHVLVEGEPVPIKEWVNSIAKDWGFLE
ncbi:hypothetical protein AJ80_06810 [Polytolypa hystricis UAMH7299]|uniref:Uncharacterized protein n=1 Tax=Polytolypa hystricis (strain UAMH7299) TaxID=1447883 RepID=A0A2B7XT77_POLH7|nr:hypothetical protein AJ80_06810 [Polytolypa hystricis UAMH7299]